MAVAYNNAEDAVVKAEMKDKFLAMYDHITDQSCLWRLLGNIHHYGYSVRDFIWPIF